jgi:hypothetical protein
MQKGFSPAPLSPAEAGAADPWLFPGAAPRPLPVGALVAEIIAVPAQPTVLMHAVFGPAAGLRRILLCGCSARGLSVLVEAGDGAAVALAAAWPPEGAATAGVVLGWDGACLAIRAAPGGVGHIAGPPGAVAALPLRLAETGAAVVLGAAPGFWAHPAVAWHALVAAPFRPFPAALLAGATRLETPQGPRRADALRPGDAVTLLGGGVAVLRAVRSRRLPARGRLAPVRLRAGFCPAARDIVVGPRQPVLADGWGVEEATGREEILVRAADLAGTRLALREAGPGTLPMVALALDRPALVMAEGHALATAGPPPMPLASPAEAAAIVARHRHRAVTR